MPAGIYHVGATAQCPHVGQISTVSSNVRVKVSGMAVATVADIFTVVGCPFNVSGTPRPCVTVQWFSPALRVRVMGAPVVLASSTGICLSAEQIPQGPPQVLATQPRVKGT